MKPTLIVLAAGIGSRYGGMKQLDPVGPGGELLIEYSIYDALQSGFERVVFLINRAIEEPFRDRVGHHIERCCDTVYAFQRLDDLPAGVTIPPDRQKPWGTAHAVWTCRHLVDSPFAVINADDFYGRSAYGSISQHLAAAAEDEFGQGRDYRYCMVGYRLADTLTEHGTVARGICTVGPGGTLVNIRERTHIKRWGSGARFTEDGETWIPLPLDTPVSMNAWGFMPSLFAELEARFPLFLVANRDNLLQAEFFVPDVVAELVREGLATVQVLPAQDRWYGVTYREDRPELSRAIQGMIERGIYPSRLWHSRP
ncbi:MAG: nucleotidyltransferase [Chloroflexi bacterium]|nr:MAG: nucleotidyltransferase [Chloroflexota bacterium]